MLNHSPELYIDRCSAVCVNHLILVKGKGARRIENTLDKYNIIISRHTTKIKTKKQNKISPNTHRRNTTDIDNIYPKLEELKQYLSTKQLNR